MALITLFAVLAKMHVILAMAADAGLRQIFGNGVGFVAGGTLQCAMRTG